MVVYFILRGINKARSENLGIRVHRAVLGVRVPRAHVKRGPTLFNVIELAEPRGKGPLDRITKTDLFIFTLHESMGINKRTLESASTPSCPGNNVIF